MSSRRRERIETFEGRCNLRLPNRVASLRCVLRIWQNFLDATPLLREVDGGFVGLPKGDTLFALLERKPLYLDLEDGRKWTVFITDTQGSFVAQPVS